MNHLLLMLATWRVTHLMVYEDAPFNFMAKFRHHIGIRYDERSQRTASNELAKAFNCPYCLSVWVGWLFALLYWRSRWAVIWGLSYSGGALLVERIINGKSND